ncbi:hypothetical protein [Bradyrhizobium jicamae]|uniref:hypothetical protein n=1 Tax=Bradyrhizobium jicamae TaxID=280332 RepID=UPI001BA75257|nr:hypothetical protein [Bradyrhizobium jicamae]MBR0936680.1 hypothetical protein [Bradyrhizobium jicamae]
MTIDGLSSKNFFLRVLLSMGITAAIGITAFFSIRGLSGAYHEPVPPQVQIGLKAKPNG